MGRKIPTRRVVVGVLEKLGPPRSSRRSFPCCKETTGLCVCILNLPFHSSCESLWAALGFLKAIKTQIFRAQLSAEWVWEQTAQTLNPNNAPRCCNVGLRLKQTQESVISSSSRGALEQRCLWSAGFGAEESSALTSSSAAAFLWLRACGAALPALGLVSCICFSLTKFTFFLC